MPPSREHYAKRFDDCEFDVTPEVRERAIGILRRGYTFPDSDEEYARAAAEAEVEIERLKARIAELESAQRA